MKKLLLLIAVAAMVLSGCGKIEESIDALSNRIDKLEQSVPTIEEQISAIQTSIKALEEIVALKEADKAIEAKIEELKASELLSLEGVILTAPDLEHGGVERTIIAYYTYYRK